MKVYNILRLF